MTDRLDLLAETGADVTIPAAALRELIPYVGHQPPGDPPPVDDHPPVDDQPPGDPPDDLTILEERIPDLSKQTSFGGIDLPEEYRISWRYDDVAGPRDNPMGKRIALTIFEVHDGTKWVGRRRLACMLISPKGSTSWFLRVGFGIGQEGGKTEWSASIEDMVEAHFVMSGDLVVSRGFFSVAGVLKPAGLPDWRMPTGATLQIGHQDGPKGVPGEGDEPFASGSGSIEIVRLAPKAKATERPEELDALLGAIADAIAQPDRARRIADALIEDAEATAQPLDIKDGDRYTAEGFSDDNGKPRVFVASALGPPPGYAFGNIMTDYAGRRIVTDADPCAQRFADDLLEAKALEFLYEVEANTREGGHLAKVDVEKYVPLWLDAFSAWADGGGEPGPAWVPLGRSDFTVSCWMYLRREAHFWTNGEWEGRGESFEPGERRLKEVVGHLSPNHLPESYLTALEVDEAALVAEYGAAALECFGASERFSRAELVTVCRTLAARELQHLDTSSRKTENHPLHGRILHLKSRRRRLENLARVEEIAAEADEVEQ